MESGFGGLPVFNVDRFVLRDGQVIFQRPDGADAMKDIRLEGSVDSDGDEIRVMLTGGSGKDIRRNLRLREAAGSMEYVQRPGKESFPGARPGDICLDSLSVHLERSEFIVSGRVDPDSMIFDLALDAFPLDVKETARLIGTETSHYGELQGRFELNGTAGRFSVRAVMGGIFSGYALEDFTLVGMWDPPVFRIDRGEGTLNGARVGGSGSYTFEKPATLLLDITTSELLPALSHPKKDMTYSRSFNFFHPFLS